MPDAWDAIVVGAGHNGLTAAAYLARAGLRVLVCERRAMVGGAAVTEEFHPGYRNSSASYVVSLLQPKVIADLDLRRHGYATIPFAGSFAPRLDGQYLLLTGDAAHDRADIAKFSNRDADAMADFGRIITAVADVIRPWLLRPPPRLAGGGLGDLLGGLALANGVRRLDPELRHRFVQLFSTGVGHLIDRWFDSDVIKMKYAAGATAGAFVSLHQPGSAINLLHLSLGEIDGARGKWAHAKGGMGAITQAMARAAEGFGATIRTSAPIERILVDKDRAVGVRLETGEEARAPIVLANTDPRRTFLTLVGERHLDPAFAADIQAYRCESASFRMNLALSGVPEFACLPGADLGVQHRCSLALTPSYAVFEDAYRAASAGEVPDEPIISAQIPTALDDGLAPPGCHVLSLLAQHFPYRLSRGRSWDDEKERVADMIVDRLARFMPNLRRILVGRMVLSPLDLERTFGLTGGDVYHGRLDPDQLFSLRPHPASARYATPIPGLYLCGAGTHPGGGVSGAPGHNAAHRVLADLGRA
jgi:phytoene dehydrogenase-like protein